MWELLSSGFLLEVLFVGVSLVNVNSLSIDYEYEKRKVESRNRNY